ncbi:MAG: hypothetical protein H0V56_12555 [Chthoniobacterales bacterium]|nr:hypothetical protein [Chthoniobacterales bacterium]
MSRNSSKSWWLAGPLILGLLLVSLGLGCLGRGYNYDEGQFVAAGALFAREGLLPYLDYPYFHLPNLVFVYAALFTTNDFLLLTARSFNIVCAWVLLLLIYRMVAAAFGAMGEKRWLIAAAVTLFFALQPIFRFTAGRAWNHDFAMLASVAAFACLLRAIEPDAGRRWMAASGVLLGLASGTRLTFLPLVAPFFLLALTLPGSVSARYRGALRLAAGFGVALLPTLALFAAAPAAFIFDNFTANGSLNISYRQATKPRPILLQKLLYPVQELKRPATLVLVAGFLVFACWQPLRRDWRAALRWPPLAATLVILPFALFGAVMPTPSYRQYYYLPLPFLLLGAVYGVARLYQAQPYHRRIFIGLGLALLISLGHFASNLRSFEELTSPERWAVFSLHRAGQELARHAGPGPVLTLEPLVPLEGGARIFPQFATGMFAWRIAPFATAGERQAHDFVGPEELPGLLQTTPPAAIFERTPQSALEEPLVRHARDNGYSEIILPEEAGFLLLPPP